MIGHMYMRCIGIIYTLHANIVGGCFVEGGWLRNAFRWRQSIGPWEERPGHFGDCWQYWTDDGLGYYEFLQVQHCTVSTFNLSFFLASSPNNYYI